MSAPFLPPPTGSFAARPDTVACSPAAMAPAVAVPGAPMVAVRPVAAPRRHRWGLGVAFVGLAAMAAAGAAVVLPGEEPAEAGYSLTAAAAQADDTSTISYRMTVSMGDLGQATVTAALDLDAELMSMTLDAEAVAGAVGPMEVVVDLAENAMYVDATVFGGDAAVLGGATWIRMDLAALTDIDVGELLAQAGDNPLDAAALFDQAQSVVDLGFDEVDGAQVKHFQVVLDGSAVLDEMPQLREQLAALGLDATSDLPEQFVYEVYVDEANQLRRLSYSLEILGQVVDSDITITATGSDVTIALPDPDEVVDISDQL